MTSTSKSSKKNFSTCIQYETTKVEDSCGLAQLKASRKASLNPPSSYHNLLPRTSHPLRSHLSRLHLLLPTRNVDSSRSCSVTSWTPLDSPSSSTQKTGVTWCVHTKTSARKSSSVLTDTLRNFWAMDCWCILGIPKPMKMILNEQYGLVWEFLLRWKT